MASFFASVFGNVVGDAISGAFGMELTVRSAGGVKRVCACHSSVDVISPLPPLDRVSTGDLHNGHVGRSHSLDVCLVPRLSFDDDGIFARRLAIVRTKNPRLVTRIMIPLDTYNFWFFSVTR